MSPKIEIFGKKFAQFGRFEGSFFGNFGDRKSRFLDFFKVVWELLRMCLGFVLSLKGPTFGCIFISKG